MDSKLNIKSMGIIKQLKLKQDYINLMLILEIGVKEGLTPLTKITYPNLERS